MSISKRLLLVATVASLLAFLPNTSWIGCGTAFSDQCPAPLCSKTRTPVTSMAVMAPLCLRDLLHDDSCATDSTTFVNQLKSAKQMGVTAVSVDVWWGLVEKCGDNKFDWSYYDKIVAAIQEAGLHWVPILSFHQCGGNIGDSCHIPIPSWIWTHYSGISPEDLKYKSEKGNVSNETVSLWMDHVVMKQYEEVMSAFVQHYGAMEGVAEITDEINISMGPAGELRYPSYNSHDTWRYPDRGFFQCYSKPARDDFRDKILKKYGSLAGVNNAWGFSLADSSKIAPPQDSPVDVGQASSFVEKHNYEKMPYGKDFIDWYNQSLLEHGKNMLAAAVTKITGPFAAKPIGMKVPGIHWQVCDNSPTPRIAEITAGIIRTREGNDSESTGYGYKPLMDMVSKAGSGRKINFHFTCLEKNNDCGNGYSQAKALVFWVAKAAEKANVTIKGENAENNDMIKKKEQPGWYNIEDAFCYAPYSGLTVLRIGDVTQGDYANYRYRCLIQSVLTPPPATAAGPR